MNEMLGLSIVPVVAIVMGIGSEIIKRILKSQERRLEMRLNKQQGQNDDVTRELQALRAEVVALRDTSTQFDMSLDHTVQRLEERVGRMETKTAAARATSDAPPQTLRNGQQP